MAVPQFNYIRFKSYENFARSKVINFVDYKYIYDTRTIAMPSDVEIVETHLCNRQS